MTQAIVSRQLVPQNEWRGTLTRAHRLGLSARFAVGLGTDAAYALEGGAEGVGGGVANLFCDRADGLIGLHEQVSGQGHAPVLQERHRRFADQLLKAPGEGSARGASGLRQAIHGPLCCGLLVHELECVVDDPITLVPPPVRPTRVLPREPGLEHGRDQKIEQAIKDGRLTLFVLDHFGLYIRAGTSRDDPTGANES